MIREFLIKLLFRLLDNDRMVGEISDKRIDEWLASLYSNMGFREYFRKRDMQLLKTMGIGLDQNSYKIWLGQRFELLRLLQKVDQAYKKMKPNPGATVRKEKTKTASSPPGPN